MTARRAARTPVVLEIGHRRVFASVADWPGWCRSGKDEQLALEALADYAGRYAAVPVAAGEGFGPELAGGLEVVERLEGDATTDFGAPSRVAELDRRPLAAAQAARLAALVVASWGVLDQVASTAPAELRKGPRGGGRDRDAVVAHVLAAEAAYARKIGVRTRVPALGDDDAVAALRSSIADALRAARSGEPAGPAGAKGWPARYAARRIAWHVLDHAWEIEDRSEP